jgi:transcriptional regulator with XRE-family HTH domain
VSFNERFAALVRGSGIQQKELARSLGLSEGAVINYQRDRIPKAAELVKIADYFGLSVDWLLRGSDPLQMSSMVQESPGMTQMLEVRRGREKEIAREIRKIIAGLDRLRELADMLDPV